MPMNCLIISSVCRDLCWFSSSMDWCVASCFVMFWYDISRVSSLSVSFDIFVLESEKRYCQTDCYLVGATVWVFVVF